MIESGVIVAFAVGMLVLCIIGKLVSLPLRLVWKFITNSIIGALLLCIVKLFGLHVQINIITALMAKNILVFLDWCSLLFTKREPAREKETAKYPPT